MVKSGVLARDSGWGILIDWLLGSGKDSGTKYFGCSCNKGIEITWDLLPDYSMLI